MLPSYFSVMVGRNLGGQRTFRRLATKARQPAPPTGDTGGQPPCPDRSGAPDEEAPSVAWAARRSSRRRSISSRASGPPHTSSWVGGVDEGTADERRITAAARRALRLDDLELAAAAPEASVAEDRPPAPSRCCAVMTKSATSSSQRRAGVSGSGTTGG